MAALASLPAGCGTTRVTSTQRTATEQLLISGAIDQSVSLLDFRVLAGKSVFFDPQYLAGGVDQGYVVSSLRQHLLACGCLLQEDRTKANYVVEARSGGIGTDLNQVLIGVPQMTLPTFVPGQPSLIPELPFAKKTDQTGVAKIAVFAYNRKTGHSVWQSGSIQTASTSKDTWVLGTGPFRRGTLGESTEFAGQQFAIPLLSGKEGGKEEEAPVLAVTQPAAWKEIPPTSTDTAGALAGKSPEASKAATAGAQAAASVASASSGGQGQKLTAVAAPSSGDAVADLHLDPIRFPGFVSAGAADSSAHDSVATAAAAQSKSAGAHYAANLANTVQR